MDQRIYEVAGMSCGDCAGRVGDAVRALGGVEEVTVDVATGRMTVVSSAPVPEEDLRAAVSGAGNYRLLAE